MSKKKEIYILTCFFYKTKQNEKYSIKCIQSVTQSSQYVTETLLEAPPNPPLCQTTKYD